MSFDNSKAVSILSELDGLFQHDLNFEIVDNSSFPLHFIAQCRKTQIKLIFRQKGNRHHVHLSTWFDYGKDYYYLDDHETALKNISCTFSTSRDPAAIAKHIFNQVFQKGAIVEVWQTARDKLISHVEVENCLEAQKDYFAGLVNGSRANLRYVSIGSGQGFSGKVKGIGIQGQISGSRLILLLDGLDEETAIDVINLIKQRKPLRIAA